MTQVTIQNILLPLEQRFDACPGLFYTFGTVQVPNPYSLPYRFGEEAPQSCPLPASQLASDEVAVDAASGALRVSAGASVSLCTYFNLLSLRKWLAYTHAERFALELELEGSGSVVLYRLDAPDVAGTRQWRNYADAAEIARVPFDFSGRQTLVIPIEASEAVCVGFDIVADSETRLFGGRYTTEVPESALRRVDICLATTTFQKEEYLTANLAMLREQIWGSGDEVGEHLDVVVVDNGRTLSADQVAGDHVRLFANKNVGGAGGFARGMIEALRSEVDYTHVLVMDDDVSMHPESFRRTYALLRLVRDEFVDCYVSGAMLRLEDMNIQHEDIGYVHPHGYFMPRKELFDLYDIRNVVLNETLWDPVPNSYAAWWFCCIPMRFVREDSLPLPLFVRGDDVEFSLRNQAGLISLAGICVWHMGFNKKFTASMEYYQVIRNSLILRACTPTMATATFFRQAYELVHYNLYRFAYNYAELILDAIEDFIAGPELLISRDGAELIREKAALNDIMVDLSAFEGIDVGLDLSDEEERAQVRVDHQSGLFKRAIRMATLNGHRLAPGFFYREGVGTAPYDWQFATGNGTGYEQILLVNPDEGTGCLHVRDMERYKAIMKRLWNAVATYNTHRAQIEQQWLDAYPRLTSQEFWKEYLGID